MDTIKVAAIQLQSQSDVAGNLAECEKWIVQAAECGAKLVVLPENFAYFGDDPGRRAAAEVLGDVNSPIQASISRLATDLDVAILAGGWPEQCGSSAPPYNSATLYGPGSSIIANYRKLHLFDVTLPNGRSLMESATVTPGCDVVACDLLGFRIGLTICYDLRFSALYRGLVNRGCEILCVPSAFTEETGKAHWELLVRARAVECQSWVIAANQCGQHPRNRRTYGHSMIVDPWGKIQALAADGPGFVTADISRESILGVRQAMPCIRHQRNL